ncbi:DUF1963 domain-containing protein [Agrobacterium rubi]|uniref:DUF1963 domain-containing protein n=1 Tax=Agrobacterium rubi TaxID=28099 RepID=A0AAE7QYX6_9HYPH|nr:YwqG family protein [Agrobacterium rubi]NTE86597.1 DUF1963 domain-containing protein [Agrobacterium rubi]NTF02529.1 DUF1963 domain-containing protein [Agrobacterium rubi]NTF36774.1 DUF1963 domain-containing protein [Agrobacterium rubi]OCJ55607.1 hypothetical protein A6U92_03210 [Agrobacterium rubi]QTF99222.1 DUF1963 domain-containing protein [Agrobacterium rubi]
MKLVETPEFLIEANPMFENVRVFAGSIGLRRHPETAFSPQMSVWSSKRERKSPEKWFGERLTDNGGKIVERKTVTFAGMTGEMSKVKDRLQDWETKEKRDWYRLRALLVSADGSTWYHATAMVSAPELIEIEADFERLLGSIRLKLEGNAANEARAVGEAERAAVLERLMDNMERVSAIRIQQSQEERRIENAAAAKAPVASIEERFDEAVADAGLEDKRDALRLIVMPTVAMVECDAADGNVSGQSRIGGGPDLPADMDWPRNDNGFHLNYLAQINLADLPGQLEELPESGLISFFTGTDYTDWRVLYSSVDATLTPHTVSEDAMETAISASQMIIWDNDLKRFVPNGQAVDGLSVGVDEAGRMTFSRDGAPVRAFASEYEFSRSAQTLRFERSLSAPFGQRGPNNNPKAYADIGIEDPSEFSIAISERFKIGDGPQHQMFGITGVRELSAIQQMAAKHAAQHGWSDISAADGWFILVKLASGGEADFNFGDHGDYIFMVHRKDAARADFSRVYAFVESG